MIPNHRATSSRAAVLAAALAAAVLAPLAPAHAAPSSSVVAVFRAEDCAAQACDPASDPKLPAGAVVTGKLQVLVHSEAQFGLEWVRLEAAHEGSDIFACVQF